jgi:hypothetical protein
VQSSGTAVGVNVPIIKAAVGGSVEIRAGGANNSKITYSSKKPLVFGFQAARLEFEQGALFGLEQINPDDVVLRKRRPEKLAGAAEPAFESLKSAGPFVNFKVDVLATPEQTAKKSGMKKAATRGAKSAPKKVAKKSAKKVTKKWLPRR